LKLQSLEHRLYYRMLLLRRVEERIVALYPEQEIKSPTHFYIGHEAVAAGVCEVLENEDVVFPYYRSHGWYLAKNGDLNAMMAELYGKATGCSKGWGGSMHLIDLKAGVMGTSAIVGGAIPHAAGAAFAMKARGEKSVSVVAHGDGAVEEGVFHETMNFSALRNLPVIFICENNLYAVNTPISERQVQPDLHKYAAQYGIVSKCLDGNDIEAVYRAASEAVAHVRGGGGPVFLECRTYRLLEHVGPTDDTHLQYRAALEVEEWRERDPLVIARHLVSDSKVAEMSREIDEKIDKALEFALSSPYPTSLFPAEGADEI
jgi:TPP-dependent pyruvate/acetoin dehydrogenase alpha subunit